MGTYRLSVVDPAGSIEHIYEVNCDCDAAARYAAELMLEESPIDIWHGDRWVGSVDGRADQRLH
jgi:hypothetical protein